MRIRKMMFVFCLLAILPMLMPAPAAALPLIDMEAAVGGWGTSPSGSMAYKGESLDLEDDFNYDDETALTGRLKIDMPLVIPNIYLMATPLEYEGTGSYDAASEFDFGDETIDATQDFDSRLTLDTYDIGLFYNVPLLETVTLGRLDMEAGLNARIIDAEAVVEQDGLYEKKSETLPLPMLYVGLGLYPVERFGLEAEARGISYGDYELVSLIGRLKVKVVGPLFVSGGYRYDTYDIEEDDLDLDVDFSGPFLETGLKF
ncbi:MAG: TIGR04219 family outer membrane beta-barrel protein [Desulfobacteraceae bacterium]|nr:TIGR04219 family outer membrane beta-barrel protein [Desulfobacteraceae bacterium]